MKLALYLPTFRNHVTVQELADLTDLAEELEFDSVWTLDRIVVPEASDREELQYSFGMMTEFPKALPVSSRGQWYQGWPLLPWLAARTTKLRIGMSITDTPYRAPGVFAAECATIDQLSNGRLILALGIGAYREEFKALQPDARMDRGDIVDEGLQALNLLFKERVASFEGKYYKFRDVELYPKPLQKHIPIYVGGNNPNNIMRTVKWADGWLPAGMHVDRLRAGVKTLHEEAEKAGRDPKTIEVCPQFIVHIGKTRQAAVESFRKSQMNKHLISLAKSTLKGQGAAAHEDINLIGTPAEIVDKANAFREAGVTHLLGLYFAANSVQELVDQMQIFGEEVTPKVKG
jgi:probable F420-dependent oxidoreductase